MIYELWDTSSRNLIGAYDTEQVALEIVRQVIKAHGLRAAGRLALGQQSKGGRSRLLATGRDLTDRARAGMPSAASSS